jgi:hypothetical protein
MHRGRVWKRPRTSNPVVPGSWRRSRNFPPRSRAENLQFSIQMSNSREVKSSRSRGADASEFWRSPHSEIEERAGKAGCRLTFSARVQQKKARGGHNRFNRIIRPSPHNGFNGVLRAPRGPGFLAPIIGEIISRRLDASVGVSGPHDFAVRSGAVRPAKKMRASPCVHRSPPHVR